MKPFSKTLLTGALALALTPLSASALPPDCDVQCVDSPPCSLVCAVPGSWRVIDCGVWAEDYWGEACVDEAQQPEDTLSSVLPRQDTLVCEDTAVAGSAAQ